jgi:hypothetical protein
MSRSDFSELDIVKDGRGKFHVNQFRIYFKIPNRPESLKTHVAELYDNFPKVFTGNTDYANMLQPIFGGEPQAACEPRRVWKGDPPANEILLRNSAQVERVLNRSYNGESPLRFTYDQKVLSGILPMLDFHDDWVGVIWRDPERGFAVRTLRRTWLNWVERRIMAQAVSSHVLRKALKVPILYPWELLNDFVSFNKNHFLAGHRSWILSRDDIQIGTGFRCSLPGQINTFQCEPWYYLETAAIERYSSEFYDFAEKYLTLGGNDSSRGNEGYGFPLPDLKSSTVRVWCVLLTNYVISKDFACESTAPPLDIDAWSQNVTLKNVTVHYRAREYDSVQDCLGDSRVTLLLKSHPALALQFHHLTPQNPPTTVSKEWVA